MTTTTLKSGFRLFFQGTCLRSGQSTRSCMRTTFRHELDQLRTHMGGMCELAGDAVAGATRGLLDVDADAARQVAVDVGRLRLLHNSVERHTLGILARQAPVARDLRTVVTAVHTAADADRMGGLAWHVAKLCLRRHPEPVIPDEMHGHFSEMGRLAVQLAGRCEAALLEGDCAQASLIQRDDQAMETLHRELFPAVMSPGWSHGPGAASDVVLLGRFYGRFADHAEEISRRMLFQSNGNQELGVYAV
jgi:phosphate transport system protein